MHATAKPVRHTTAHSVASAHSSDGTLSGLGRSRDGSGYVKVTDAAHEHAPAPSRSVGTASQSSRDERSLYQCLPQHVAQSLVVEREKQMEREKKPRPSVTHPPSDKHTKSIYQCLPTHVAQSLSVDRESGPRSAATEVTAALALESQESGSRGSRPWQEALHVRSYSERGTPSTIIADSAACFNACQVLCPVCAAFVLYDLTVSVASFK